MEKTTQGLIDLLKRKGLTPTGDRDQDLKLAWKVMPAPLKRRK